MRNCNRSNGYDILDSLKPVTEKFSLYNTEEK